MHPFSQRSFTIREILYHEAKALSRQGPSRGEPKEPECNSETFTRLHNLGAGACRIKRWPNDEDPYDWGCRNETLLLDETIHSPARWEIGEEYRGPFNDLLRPIDNAYMGSSMRIGDKGYEEQLLFVLNSTLRRITAIAFIFLIQLWRRGPEYISHPDYHIVFDALHHFSVQRIRNSERSTSHDIGIIVPRTFYPQMGKTEELKPLVVGMILRTGFAEKTHAANERGCETADEVLSSVLDNNADGDINVLFKQLGLRNDWQSVAVGHIVQVKTTTFCTSAYRSLLHQDVLQYFSLWQPDGLIDFDMGMPKVFLSN